MRRNIKIITVPIAIQEGRDVVVSGQSCIILVKGTRRLKIDLSGSVMIEEACEIRNGGETREPVHKHAKGL